MPIAEIEDACKVKLTNTAAYTKERKFSELAKSKTEKLTV